MIYSLDLSELSTDHQRGTTPLSDLLLHAEGRSKFGFTPICIKEKQQFSNLEDAMNPIFAAN